MPAVTQKANIDRQCVSSEALRDSTIEFDKYLFKVQRRKPEFCLHEWNIGDI